MDAKNLIKTEAELNALSSKDLVELFNDLSEKLGGEPIRRFADKTSGIKRTLKLVEAFEKTLPAKPAPKKGSAPAAERKPAARRGTHLTPFGIDLIPCREGTKQAILRDTLMQKGGATMPELIDALSGGKKPWTEVTVRSGLGWDMRNKGYGVESSFDKDGTERFKLIVPEGQKAPAHTPLATATPKAHAAQKRLEV